MNNLQTKLKHRLLDLGITQKELADKIGVHKQVVANWLNGSRNPKRDNIKKLCEVLDLPMSFFYEEIDTSTIQPLNELTTIKMPILSVAICGKPDFCTIDEQVIDDFVEVPKALFPDGNFIVRCLGDSMLPEIPPKAYCIIKKMDIPLNNKNMLIKTTDGFTIKRVKVIDGKIRLYFLNPANKELKASSVQIIGKVIGIYQKY